MNSATVFIVSATAVTLIALAFVLPPSKWKDYFSTDDGKGVLKGVLLAVLFGALLSVSSLAFSKERGYILPEASVFLGLDRTFDPSPQCEPGGIDDKLTSNLGLRVTAYETYDRKFLVNGKYTHHSCAFGVDDRSYDAVGIELEYRLWHR